MDISLLVNTLSIEKIIIYGNRACTSNDIDLLIVSDDFIDVFRQKRKKLVEGLISSDKPIDPICLTNCEYRILLDSSDDYRTNVIERGEIIYDKSIYR